jgi:catechol 2,3-dioxygenase-like lactoylglutathione lyase family enzyme
VVEADPRLHRRARDPNEPGHEECLIVDPATGHQLLFIEVPESKTIKNRIHFDLSPTDRRRDEEIERVLSSASCAVTRSGPDGRRHPPGRAVDLNHLNLRVGDADACLAFYQEHFGFTLAFEAEGGYFLRNGEGFLLALMPAATRQELPDGFHIGFGLATPEAVSDLHDALDGAGARLTAVEDHRPDEAYVTFRCWDPDGTEVEVYWDSP